MVEDPGIDVQEPSQPKA